MNLTPRTYSLILIAFALLSINGCTTIKGSTLHDQRNYVMKMHDETINQLYQKHPDARQQITSSAGYAIFSNINTNLIFVTTSGGYGVTINNSNRHRTYMKMAGFGVGLGAGIRDMRLVMIFKKKHDFDSFVDNGWDLSGQAGASAQSDEQGGHLTAARSIDFDIISYQLTKAGLSIEATIDGTKFWQHPDLN